MSRERLLLSYCLLYGGAGWLWLLVALQGGGLAAQITATDLLAFGLLALVIDSLSFRSPPGDPQSLTGLALLTAALVFGPPTGALIAAIEGLLFGIALPFLYNRPRNLYSLLGRPMLRSGTRTLGILAGAALAGWLAGSANDLLLAVCMTLTYGLAVLLARVGREYLQGGRSGVQTWWRSSWRLALGVEFAPLPLAALWAAVYTQLGAVYFVLSCIGVVLVSGAVQRAALNLQSQRRSVRELALLNEVSRAIIRSELDVALLCELIYREASKIVDTASFHLGLFDGDAYTLMIRTQDRVRLPPLTVTLDDEAGIIPWLRRTGRALLVEDFMVEMDRLPARPRYQSEHPPRSGIYVPLIAGDTVIGSISIQSYQPAAFRADDLRLLSLIADQAAVAIARARAFAETRQRARQLQAIQQVSERVTAILNLDELLPSVVRLINEYFGYQPVHIFTLEADATRILFRASTADPAVQATLRTVPLRVGEGIIGAAVAAGQPLLVNDVRRDPRYIADTSATRAELAVPLRVGDQIIGVLDVQSDKPDDFNADDLFVMRTLADQIAIAIDSANSYRAQQEEAWTLNALLQITENVSRAANRDELLAVIVRLPPLLVGCDRCYFLFWEQLQGQFRLAAAYGLNATQRTALIDYRFDPAQAALLARVHSELQLVHIPFARSGLQPGGASCLPPVVELCASGTLVALPIVARSSLLGVLILDYNQIDMLIGPRRAALYTGTMAQVAAALESVLLAEEAAAAARLEQELRVAREIQTALLPAMPPQLPGWQIAAEWRSARLVGGDFYDFWHLERRKVASWWSTIAAEDLAFEGPPLLGFVIADVSDKGVPAALFMAMARSLTRAAALDGSPPAIALERANRWITRDSESGMFVTVFYALLDPLSGGVCYSCAGHNPPLVLDRAQGGCTALRTPGIALGVLDEIKLQNAWIGLAAGDLLLAYTDGVVEAINRAGDAFEVERLRDVAVTRRADGAPATLAAINQAVADFTSGQPPFDDVTLLLVQREE